MTHKPHSKHDALEAYNTVAETVAGPSLRWKDNLIQAVCVIGGLLLGAGIGTLFDFPIGTAIGAVAGMVASTLISGIVLMVLGWVRAARKARNIG